MVKLSFALRIAKHKKAIAKAGVADCGIVTVQTYQGIIGGLFDDKILVDVVHTKNLNRGDVVAKLLLPGNRRKCPPING